MSKTENQAKELLTMYINKPYKENKHKKTNIMFEMDAETTLGLMTQSKVKALIVVNDEQRHTVKGLLKADGDDFSVESLAFKAKHVTWITFIESDLSEAEIYIRV